MYGLVRPSRYSRRPDRASTLVDMTRPAPSPSTRRRSARLQDPGSVAHIVKDKGKVTEAYILGTPVEALCGHVFTPSKDPKSLPVCDTCKDIADIRTDGKGGDIT